ncbi:hypothetical protein PEDI_12000 [Persicobacter diffluens]|uniref:Uncharacterized protein n=1 Tax=Persicobacter diffluens TaxID=981 RepID=A0AAN4VXA4_9BACT|nr:hypothetical protein PEDI_12000 [Persicobacter diffluens]
MQPNDQLKNFGKKYIYNILDAQMDIILIEKNINKI